MARPLRPDDLCELRRVGGVDLHGASGAVAFTVEWPDAATDENRANIHLHDGAGVRRLTDGHRDTDPRFSPGGGRLAFLRAEPGEPSEPAIADVATGEVSVVAGFEDDGATTVRWLDEDHLVVLAPRRPPDQVGVDAEELAKRPRVLTRLDYRFNGRGWIHDRPRQVLVVDLSDSTGGRLRALTDGAADCSAFAITPDGSAVLVVAATDPDADLTGTNRVWLHRLAGGPPDALTPPGGHWAQVGWTSDGQAFAVGRPAAGEVGFDRPHLLEADRDPAPIGPHDVNCTLLTAPDLPPVVVDGAILLPGVHGGSVTVDRYDPGDGSRTTVASGRFVIGSFAADATGDRIVASVSTPTRPAELWELTGAAGGVLFGLNDDLLADLDLVEPETVQVTADDGTAIEAWVLSPPPSAPSTGETRPGLVLVHGGPLAAYGHGFFDELQLAAGAGYVVIAGNPRGSDGYGEAWGRAVVGRMGGPDWVDVQAITAELARRPDVDAARIGIAGGSYGGFMAAWAISHSDHYRAALVERAVVSFESLMGTSDIGTPFTAQYLRATVESDVEAVRAQSPLTYAARVRTPTLILHSEEDWRCPIEQAEQLFAAYRRNGVDVTLVRFPDENHELTRSGSPRHRVERFRIVHGFFADHLGGAVFD